MEIGEYVRTKSGYIGKLTEIISFDTTPIEYFCTDNNIIMPVGEIKAHSKNIIDLIETGDYVNGQKVMAVSNISGWVDTKEDVIYKDHIKTILTHELYEENSYKVVE